MEDITQYRSHEYNMQLEHDIDIPTASLRNMQISTSVDPSEC